jgi:hypothetical protein
MPRWKQHDRLASLPPPIAKEDLDAAVGQEELFFGNSRSSILPNVRHDLLA